MKKNILILSYSDLGNDPRVIRQINALKELYSITASGYKASDIKVVRYIPIYLKEKREIDFHFGYPVPVRKAISLFTKNYIRFEKRIKNNSRKSLERSENFHKRYWTADKLETFKRLEKEKYDLIIANDIETLPLALKLSGNKVKVILDSHEYHPRQFEHNPEWVKYSQQYIEYLCREYMPKADITFAVSQGIADEFRKNYKTNPILLTNATEYNELKPVTVNEKKIRLIHHGAAIKARDLELMTEMMEYTDDRFSLDLMLIPTDREYYLSLKEKLALNKKVKLIDPVMTKDIPSKLNSYDIGLFILPHVNFNYRHALPNKFFEFIQARLAVAIGPSSEMADYVSRYGLGITADDFKPRSMAEKLNRLNAEEIFGYKENADRYSGDLSAEKNIELIREIVSELLFGKKIKYAEQN